MFNNIELVVFDLSGTTVQDDNAVAKSLYEAGKEFKLDATLQDFEKTIGTNKIKLYQYMIARSKGEEVTIDMLEKGNFESYYDEAIKIFNRYTIIMIEYYRKNVAAMPGAEEVFESLHQKGIKVATDTGFHHDVNEAIMEGLGWREKGLIDLSVHVETTGGIGRPAPFMIFHAMKALDVQSVHKVIKVGDTPADLLSGYNAGCAGNIGVLSGANSIEVLEKYRHTHILKDITELPDMITSD